MISRADRTNTERTWPRCPCCRTRRSSAAALLAHQTLHGHKPCTCGGYHHPHRPYSPLCDLNPVAGVLRAKDLTDDAVRDALEEIAFSSPGRPLKVWPF